MSEIKPRSMRMSDENYSKLQTLSENRSLDETIAFLLRTYEKDEERNALGVQSVKLDEFDELLQAVRSNYATALQTSAQAKEIARSELLREVASKEEERRKSEEEMIRLQNRLFSEKEENIKQLQKVKDELEESTKAQISIKETLLESNKVLEQKQQALDVLTKALSQAEKKASQVEVLQEQIKNLQNQLENFERIQIEYKKLSNELEQVKESKLKLQDELEKNKKEAKEELVKELMNKDSMHKLELEQIRTSATLSIREAKLDAATQINEIREKYQDKMMELLEKNNGMLK